MLQFPRFLCTAEIANYQQTLVLVYQKLLEFYKVVYETLTEKGVKLVLKILIESGRLPAIISEFIQHAAFLHELIGKATAEIVQEIHQMAYNQEGSLLCRVITFNANSLLAHFF